MNSKPSFVRSSVLPSALPFMLVAAIGCAATALMAAPPEAVPPTQVPPANRDVVPTTPPADTKQGEAPTAANTAAKQEPTGAAVRYLEIFERMTPAMLKAARFVKFDATGYRVLEYPKTQTRVEPLPIENINANLERAGDVIAQLIATSSVELCDFAIVPDPSGKPSETEAKLLSNMRSAVTLLSADAARLWSEGETDPAVEHLAAIFRMSRHACGVRTPALAFVAASMITSGDVTTRVMINGSEQHKMSKAQRETLLAELNTFDEKDPFGFLPAMDRMKGEDRVSAERYSREATQRFLKLKELLGS